MALLEEKQREALRRVASTITEGELPSPRLELRWHKLGGTQNKYRCEYSFVLPITQGDAREGSYVCHGSELRFEMGWTEVDGRQEDSFPLDKDGVLHVPFRDGHHIAWDSHMTKFPAYVVWDGGAQFLSPRKPVVGPPMNAKERAVEEDPNWASKEFRRELDEVKKALWKFHTRVETLRDEQPSGWVRSYYRAMAMELANRIANIGDSFFYRFPDWLAERGRRFIPDATGVVVTICSECGKEVPQDLTQACEHVVGPEEKAFLERCKKERR